MAVDASQRYLMVEHDGERLIVSEARAPTVVPGAKVAAVIPGSDLVGRAYEPLFQYHAFQGTAFRIVHSSEVSHDEGTGALHIAPPYGSLDFEIGRVNRVEIFDPVDEGGRFTSSVPELLGRAARDSDADVMRMVESKGRLFKWGLIKHSYPFCWRCDTALIYKPLGSWFVRTSQVKDRMVALNDEIRWVPGTFKTERFGSFLADVRDWAIGRSRYWGTPLPIWRCANGHEVCVGSIDELARLSVAPLPGHLDLHRPQVDGIVLRCPECSGTMARDEQVIDCWYDSGCAPFAQYHYPFENIEEFDGHRSVDFISESVDQTQGLVLHATCHQRAAVRRARLQVRPSDGPRPGRGRHEDGGARRGSRVPGRSILLRRRGRRQTLPPRHACLAVGHSSPRRPSARPWSAR